MIRITPSAFVVPSVELRGTMDALAIANHPAFVEIAFAAKGPEIAHLQFCFRGRTLAVCSRVRRSRPIEIAMGSCVQGLPASIFATGQLREADPARRARATRS